MTETSLLLIAGIPATGKSNFGCWLEREHRYVHVDIEKPSRRQILGLDPAWTKFCQTNDVAEFVSALQALGTHVLLDWGFPPERLDLVREMKREGVEIWWFDGDRAEARKQFVARGTVPVSKLDCQMQKIESHRPDILDLFGSNQIDVIHSSGRWMPPEEIWRHIARHVS